MLFELTWGQGSSGFSDNVCNHTLWASSHSKIALQHNHFPYTVYAEVVKLL